MSDLSHSGAQMQRIRKDLYRVQKEIDKMKLTLKKTDPLVLLENFLKDGEEEEQMWIRRPAEKGTYYKLY